MFLMNKSALARISIPSFVLPASPRNVVRSLRRGRRGGGRGGVADPFLYVIAN